MQSKILLVAKKEWRRFFCDRRMVISALVFPCVLLYVIYSFFVPLIINISTGSDKNITVYTINTPFVIQNIFEQIGIEPAAIQEYEKEKIIEGITQINGNFLIEFPKNFIEDAEAYDVLSGEIAPQVLLYYNSLADGYMEVFSKILSALNIYEKSIAKKFDINETGGGDLAVAGASQRHLLALVLPVFLLVFIFHGAMAATTEAITGEKERGTFATIFITSITPLELSAGKILALGIQAFLCGISAAIGTTLALPRFIDSVTSMFASVQDLPMSLQINTISITQYSMLDIGLLILVLLSTSCFIVALIAIVSIHAKTTKEAQMLIYPVIIVFLFVSFLTTINNSAEKEMFHYLIPIYNSVQSLSELIGQSYTFLKTAVTIGINIFLGGIGCVTLSRLIKTEKIMVT